MTMASQPQRLPAIAKPLLASESLMRSVSGLLLTTANLADVVSGLPTSGLKAKMSGASGASGSAVGAAFVEQQPRAQAAAAEELAQHRLGQRHALGAAVSRRRCGDSSRDSRRACWLRSSAYPPASAERITAGGRPRRVRARDR